MFNYFSQKEKYRFIRNTGCLLHIMRNHYNGILFFSSITRSSIFEVDIGSRADVGSSMSITSGLTARALAMHSLCCCPPESPRADFFNRSFTSSQIAAFFNDCSTISSRADYDLIPCVLGPKAILSYMLIGKGLGF